MSRGGGRGGRGGRGGISKSFNREQLNALGVGGNDLLPTLVTQPAPLYPLLDKRPVPLHPSLELDYLLILKQDFIDHMQLSGSYLKLPQEKTNEPDLVPQLPKEKYDWSYFPSELRPKILAKRVKKKTVKEVNINDRLQALEKLEQKSMDVTTEEIKQEIDPEELEEVEDDQDEEMDDGTDYANNYFDNGEDYEDEDDKLDDDPIY